MSRGINKVILVGTLGRDPETKYLPSGSAVTSVSLATSETWKDKVTGEKKESTEWHKVVFFNKLAEIAGEYLRKGQQVYVEGSLKTRKWQGQDGQDRYTTEIVASDMQMLGGRASNGESQATSQPQSPPPRQNSNASQRPSRSFEDFDDDLPF